MKLGLLIFLVVVAVLVQDVFSVVQVTESSNKRQTTKRKPIKADPAMRYDIFDRRKRDLIEHEKAAAAAVGGSYF